MISALKANGPKPRLVGRRIFSSRAFGLDPPMRIYANGYGIFELNSQRRQRLLPNDRRIEKLIIG
jgi:hypothetical protein